MCALLGMDFTQPIFAGFSFREFGRMSEENADGWGLAWYPDQSAALIKEPVRWGESPHMEFLNSYKRTRARIYLAHVRHRTVGAEPTHADTHPFLREWAGRDYCFAHNGTIAMAAEILRTHRFRPLGRTDSEQVFCYLLEKMANSSRQQLNDEDSWVWLHRQLTELNGHGKLNILMTDGQRMFCYRDSNGWKNLACCHVYILGHDTHHFEDITVQVDVEGETLNRGIVMATQPLGGQGWRNLELGELLVLEKGRIRFSTHERTALAK